MQNFDTRHGKPSVRFFRMPVGHQDVSVRTATKSDQHIILGAVWIVDPEFQIGASLLAAVDALVVFDLMPEGREDLALVADPAAPVADDPAAHTRSFARRLDVGYGNVVVPESGDRFLLFCAAALAGIFLLTGEDTFRLLNDDGAPQSWPRAGMTSDSSSVSPQRLQTTYSSSRPCRTSRACPPPLRGRARERG